MQCFGCACCGHPLSAFSMQVFQRHRPLRVKFRTRVTHVFAGTLIHVQGTQPLQLQCATAESISGAQLIARASPAMQNAEREILNLRLCSAHPFIIHMHEVANPFYC